MSDVSFTGSIPHHYDRSLGPVLFEPYARRLAERVASVEPARVLETAAGTGIATRRLRDRLGARPELVATDLNAPMLEIARTKFESNEKVEFRVADACALPFPDRAFDAVCCQFGVMFFPDKDRGYSEVRRVLRPGGTYVFNVWDSMDANPAAAVVTDVAHRALGGVPPPFYRVPHGYHGLDAIRGALHRAGFERIAIEVLPTKAGPGSAASLARGLLLGTPFSEQVRGRGAEPETLVEEATEELERRFGEEGPPLRAIQIEARIQ